MKQYLVLALAAIALAFAAPSAFATRVIFDPPGSPLPPPSGNAPPAGTDCTTGVPSNNFTPCLVSQLDTLYWVNFVDCTTRDLEPGWCLFMKNTSGQTLTKFTFEFTIPMGDTQGNVSYDGTNVLQCFSQPPGLATDDCAPGEIVNAGEMFKVSFFGPIEDGTNFSLITDFINNPGNAGVTVSSVPEPGTLGMFGLGLLVLGAGVGLRRRCQALRSGEAV